MKDKKKFGNYMAMMGEVYGKDVTGILVEAYWVALNEFSDTDCEESFKTALATCKFFPRPAELIALMPQKKIEANKALLEADKILTHLKYYGATEYPDMADPVTKHLMTGRWNYKRWASSVLENELVWWKKEFMASYEALRESDIPLQISCESGGVKKLIENIGGAKELK